MERPKQRHYNAKKGTTTLYFDDDKFSEYRMRGGVLFPEMYDNRGQLEIRGHILMAAQEEHSKRVYVYEDITFYTVEPHIDGSGKIEFQGIAEWLNNCWMKYYAHKYYWFQNSEIARKYRLQIARSRLIGIKPVFIEVDMRDVQIALSTVYQYIKERKIYWPKGAIFTQELVSVDKNDKVLPPSIHALAVMLAGIEKSPYRAEPLPRKET